MAASAKRVTVMLKVELPTYSVTEATRNMPDFIERVVAAGDEIGSKMGSPPVVKSITVSR